MLGPICFHNRLWDGQFTGERMETEGRVAFGEEGQHRMPQGADSECTVLGLNLGQAS